MIRKYYEVICDYCHRGIDYWPHRPTEEELTEAGIIVRGRKVYCNSYCEENAIHDAKVLRVGNLKQYRKPTKRL